jgi:hypothetical protein
MLCSDLSSADVDGMTHINAKTAIAWEFCVLTKHSQIAYDLVKLVNLTFEGLESER